jgi:hypothetical protein
MILTQSAHLNFRQPRSFGLAQYYPPLKSRTIILGSVYLTHQLRSSFGSSIHHALVIEFTSTLLKPTGGPKSIQNPVGAGTGVATGGFGRVPRVWLRADFYQTCPVAIPKHPRPPSNHHGLLSTTPTTNNDLELKIYCFTYTHKHVSPS